MTTWECRSNSIAIIEFLLINGSIQWQYNALFYNKTCNCRAAGAGAAGAAKAAPPFLSHTSTKYLIKSATTSHRMRLCCQLDTSHSTYNEINSIYCNVSVCLVCRTVIVLASGPTRRVHTVMLYAILILRARTNPLANNEPSYLHCKLIIIKIVHLTDEY